MDRLRLDHLLLIKMVYLQALILKEKQNLFMTCGIYDLVLLDHFFLQLFKANGALNLGLLGISKDSWLKTKQKILPLALSI